MRDLIGVMIGVAVLALMVVGVAFLASLGWNLGELAV